MPKQKVEIENARMWKYGLQAILFLVIIFGLLGTGIKIGTMFGKSENQIKQPTNSVHGDETQCVQAQDPVPVHVEQPTQYWLTNTAVFLQAILPLENGPNDNPWNFTPDYLDNVRMHYCDLIGGDLSDWDYAGKLVRAYNTIHKARNDQHAAAMHRKGPSGCKGDTGRAYGKLAQNIIWEWERRQYAPAPWEGK